MREVGGEHAILRTSLGRVGEESTLQATDGELVARSLAELAELAGISGTLSINIIDGKHFYDFIYSIPEQGRWKAAG